jgi:hypothetical protein
MGSMAAFSTARFVAEADASTLATSWNNLPCKSQRGSTTPLHVLFTKGVSHARQRQG